MLHKLSNELNMRLNHLFYIFAAITFVACSSDENAPEEEVVPKLEITASNLKIAPFEKLTLTLSPDYDLLWDRFDSLKWVANGSFWDGTITIGLGGDDTSNPNEYDFTDYQLGKHKIFIYGYKNDEIIDQDEIEYEVIKPTGDFFNLKWNQFSGSSYQHKSYNYISPSKLTYKGTSRVYTNVRLGLSHTIENGNEYVTLRFTPHRATFSRALPDLESIDWFSDSREDYIARAELEYTFLHEYMNNLYGAPEYIYTGDDVTQTDLMDKYHALFTHEYDPDAYPVAIWFTPTTYICLLQYNSRWEGMNIRAICMVVAEPRPRW